MVRLSLAIKTCFKDCLKIHFFIFLFRDIGSMQERIFCCKVYQLKYVLFPLIRQNFTLSAIFYTMAFQFHIAKINVAKDHSKSVHNQNFSVWLSSKIHKLKRVQRTYSCTEMIPVFFLVFLFLQTHPFQKKNLLRQSIVHTTPAKLIYKTHLVSFTYLIQLLRNTSTGCMVNW